MGLLDKAIRAEALLSKTNYTRHRFYASSSQPLSLKQLLEIAKSRGDHDLLALRNDHPLGYAGTGGSSDLRIVIAERYGSSITAENVVVFPGSQTGMTLTFLALLNKSDHTIIITPSYQSLEEGPTIAGCNITRVALSPDNCWELDVEAVEKEIRDNTNFIILNDPHNPSGHVMKKETQSRLIELAEEHNIFIFSDEVYRLLEHNSDDRLHSIADLYDKGIALGTMSKAYGAGGIGVGWVVCQDMGVIEKLQTSQHIFAVSVSRPGEILAMMALRATDEIVGNNINIIKYNLLLLDKFIQEYEKWFEWVRPNAGGTAFVKFKGPLTGNELAEQLLIEGILVFPPSIFDCNKNLEQYFRIGYSRTTMPDALGAFKRFVDKNIKKWDSSASLASIPDTRVQVRSARL